jgi:hypothetical protein
MIKNFGAALTGWLEVLLVLGYVVGAATIVLGGMAWIYFLGKEREVMGGPALAPSSPETF